MIGMFIAYLGVSVLTSVWSFGALSMPRVPVRNVSLVVLVAGFVMLAGVWGTRSGAAFVAGLIALWLAGLVFWSALWALMRGLLPEPLRRWGVIRFGFGFLATLPAPIAVVLMVMSEEVD